MRYSSPARNCHADGVVWLRLRRCIRIVAVHSFTTRFVNIQEDNYSTRNSAAVQRWLKPMKRRRSHFHFKPTSSFWLNQVERWCGLITDKRIRRAVAFIRSTNWNARSAPSSQAGTIGPARSSGRRRPTSSTTKVRRCKESAVTAHWWRRIRRNPTLTQGGRR
jgi:hypothetical protein